VGPRALRSLWGLDLGSTQSWPQHRLSDCQSLEQDFIQQDSDMIAQEVIMVCDMQAAQCIAQASCYGEGTVDTAANGYLGRCHSQQLTKATAEPSMHHTQYYG